MGGDASSTHRVSNLWPNATALQRVSDWSLESQEIDVLPTLAKCHEMAESVVRRSCPGTDLSIAS